MIKDSGESAWRPSTASPPVASQILRKKDHLIGNGQLIFKDSELFIESKAVFCFVLDYSWSQSKLSKTLLHLRVLY